MSKRTIPSVTKDLEEVLAYLSTLRVIDATPSSETRLLAKKVHACTYSLILWKFRLKSVPAYGRPFVEEIASDALQILPHILLGFGKTTKILARGLIENTLRFIYYSDHPVEFRIMNQDNSKYISIIDLLTYARNHPDLAKSEREFDAVNRMHTLHDQLSAGIHGRRVADLEMKSSLTKVHLDHKAALKEAEVIRRCTEAANFALAIFNKHKLLSFSVEDRRVILRNLPKAARGIWGEFA